MDNVVFQPHFCGLVYGRAKAQVFGLAYDHAQTLIALSVQGPTTLIEAIHYDLQGQDGTFTATPLTGQEYYRYTHSRKSHYRVLKAPIPDTTDVSLIMLNDSLFGLVKDAQFTHVWHRDVESFKVELLQRVRQIVYVAVKPEWSDFLYLRGMSPPKGQRNPLCGRLPNRADGLESWMSAGFSVAYVSTNREAWESLISHGLREEVISL